MPINPLLFNPPVKSTEQGPSQQLGKQDFLNLLMVQLRNQDPLNVQDDREFIAQMAQFSSLEQSTNMTSAIENLVSFQQLTQGSALLGREVEGLYIPEGSDQAEPIKGFVTEARISGSDLILKVNDKDVLLKNLTRVTDAFSLSPQ
jgi:flagellar basal-body rod modification protein FlgD